MRGKEVDGQPKETRINFHPKSTHEIIPRIEQNKSYAGEISQRWNFNVNTQKQIPQSGFFKYSFASSPRHQPWAFTRLLNVVFLAPNPLRQGGIWRKGLGNTGISNDEKLCCVPWLCGRMNVIFGSLKEDASAKEMRNGSLRVDRLSPDLLLIHFSIDKLFCLLNEMSLLISSELTLSECPKSRSRRSHPLRPTAHRPEEIRTDS